MVQLPPHLNFLFLLILFDTTSRIMGGCTNQRLAPPSGNLTPPRISPSCPHCLRLWLDSEYRLVVSLRNSLPKLLWAGWGPLVTFLGRLLCGASAQVSLRAPAASLFPLVRGPPTDVVSCRICNFQDSRGGNIYPLTFLTAEKGVVRTKFLNHAALPRPYADAYLPPFVKGRSPWHTPALPFP